MSPATSSRAQSDVIEYMSDERALDELLDILGVDPGRPVRDNQNIFCPMPGHDASDPNCTVRAQQGLFYCQTSCATITLAELVMAHGKASSAGEAMRWIQDVMRIPSSGSYATASNDRSAPREAISDPSLDVDLYATLNQLSPATVEKFGLATVFVEHFADEASSKGEAAALIDYEPGWYAATLMPYGPGLMPRMRSLRPGMKNWPAKAWRTSPTGPKSYRPADSVLGPYGLEQLAFSPDVPNTILIVEGESDVHALHEIGFTACIGIPGKTCTRTIAHAIPTLLALVDGDIDAFSRLKLVAAVEPRAPKFVPDLRAHFSEAVMAYPDLVPPRVAALTWRQLPSAPGDAKDLHLARPFDALKTLLAGLAIALTPAPQPLSAVDALAVKRAEARGEDHPASLSPSAPSASEPTPAPPRPQAEDPWDCFGTFPEPDLMLPVRFSTVAGVFIRSPEGWMVEKAGKTSDDPPERHWVCSPFVLLNVQSPPRDGDESPPQRLRTMIWNGETWAESVIDADKATDAAPLARVLGLSGVTFGARRRPDAVNCMSGQALLVKSERGVTIVPERTGWVDKRGLGLFGGIDTRPHHAAGARMFDANARRRAAVPSTAGAARDWYDQIAGPLMAPTPSPEARHSAALLSFGTCAAAPLLSPLREACGVDVSPVAWLAGEGGGGKTTLQRACAAIYAPPAGHEGFMMNADVSQAGLYASADAFWDLPVILDDVMQIAAPKDDDASRVLAAARTGMAIFNQKGPKRATQQGGEREEKQISATALFSAEISLADDSIGARLSMGQYRRIISIECAPMDDRGIEAEYAQGVGSIARRVGGAPGEMLLDIIRELVRTRTLVDRWRAAKVAIEAVAVEGLESTQLEGLALSALGFSLLREACGGSSADGLAEAAEAVQIYTEGQGLTRAQISGVQRCLDAVADLRGSNPRRFESPDSVLSSEEGGQNQLPMSFSGLWGREVILRKHPGRVYTCLNKSGMAELFKLGVTPQMIDQCVKHDAALKRVKARMWGKDTPVWMTGFVLPPDTPDEPDVPEPPHDVDPHGLRDVEPEESLDAARPAAAPAPTAPTRCTSDEPETIAPQHWPEDTRLVRPVPTLQAIVGDEIIVQGHFQWNRGTYLAKPEADLDVLHGLIEQEATVELGFLIDMHTPEASDDPAEPMPARGGRWDIGPMPDRQVAREQVLGVGEQAARDWFVHAGLALTRATEALQQHGEDSPEYVEAYQSYLKLYRLHIIGRFCAPELFVETIAS